MLSTLSTNRPHVKKKVPDTFFSRPSTRTAALMVITAAAAAAAAETDSGAHAAREAPRPTIGASLIAALAAEQPEEVARLADTRQAGTDRGHVLPQPGKKQQKNDEKKPVMSLEQRADRVVVTVDGEPFTEYLFQKEGLRRPVLFPIFGPHGLTLTRSWPVGPKLPGDPLDHPHHESFWFAHGDVNGHDFWTTANGERIEQVSLDRVGEGQIEASSRWLAPDGSVVCTDRRLLTFATEGDDRIIDHTITIIASHGPLAFGDTKEGTMAIRVRPELNMTTLKEGPPATGHYLNAVGDRDAAAWGRPAAWVDLSGSLDGKPVGIACFDHPTNLGHPTCWHARDYGLFAANPFGLHDFTKAPKNAGRFELAEGDRLTLRHRWLLHMGHAEAANVAERFAAWAKEAD